METYTITPVTLTDDDNDMCFGWCEHFGQYVTGNLKGGEPTHWIVTPDSGECAVPDVAMNGHTVKWHGGEGKLYELEAHAQELVAILGGDESDDMGDYTVLLFGTPYSDDGEAVNTKRGSTIGDIAKFAWKTLNRGQSLDVLDDDGSVVLRYINGADNITYRVNV